MAPIRRLVLERLDQDWKIAIAPVDSESHFESVEAVVASPTALSRLVYLRGDTNGLGR